ncbi:MAG TPA: hypothetical protein VGC15_16980 [Acetobacteraceae bacterium]
MNKFLLAATLAALLTSQARAADSESWIDAKRMLAYGTLTVITSACKTNLTADQAVQIKTGLQKASDSQHDMTQDEFTDVMKAVGAEIGENKDEICATITPDFIATSLKDAAATS